MPKDPNIRIVRRAMPARLRSAFPADMLGDSDSPRALNVRFRFNSVREAPGRDLLNGPIVAEQVQAFARYPAFDGTEWVLKFTTASFLKWGITAPATPRIWNEVTAASTAIGVTNRLWNTVTAEDKAFFTNGGSDVFVWPSGTAPATDTYTTLTALATAGTAPDGRFLEYYNGRLFVGYTTESGTVFANRIRWSINGDFRDWDDTTGLGAGFLELLEESQEPITGLRTLGDRLVVYKSHAIIDIVKTGNLDLPFEQEVRVRGIGTDSPYTIASNGVVHFFLGNDFLVYAWNGIQPTPISLDIDSEIRSIVDPADVETYFGAVSTSRGEYWLVLNENDVFVYDYLRNSWTRDSFASLTALQEVEDSQTAHTWLTIPGTWENQTETWEQLGAIQFTTFWGGRSDGATFRIDDMVISDYFTQGSIIDKLVETPDIYLAELPTEQARLNRVFFIYDFINDDAFAFSYSFDRGTTWNERTITPTASGFSMVDINESGNIVRFRLRANNATGRFRWKQFVYEWIAEGPFLPTDSQRAV